MKLGEILRRKSHLTKKLGSLVLSAVTMLFVTLPRGVATVEINVKVRRGNGVHTSDSGKSEENFGDPRMSPDLRLGLQQFRVLNFSLNTRYPAFATVETSFSLHLPKHNQGPGLFVLLTECRCCVL
jgi:hypothetical protein